MKRTLTVLSIVVAVMMVFIVFPGTVTASPSISNAQALEASQSFQSSYTGSYQVTHPPTIVLNAFNNLLLFRGNYSFENTSFLTSSGHKFSIISPGETIVGNESNNATLFQRVGNYTAAFILGQSDNSKYNMTIGITNISLMMEDNNILESIRIINTFLFFSSVSTKSNNVSPNGIPPPSNEQFWTHTLIQSTNIGYWYANNTALTYNQTIFSSSVNITIGYYNSTGNQYIASGIVQIKTMWITEIYLPWGEVLLWGNGVGGGNTFIVYDSTNWEYQMSLYDPGGTYGWDNATVSYTHQHVEFYVGTQANWNIGDNDQLYVQSQQSVWIPQLT